ncbi:nicotinamidase-related amidase [Kribbella aluminosa]|uniref:Nicotinamidase-related amidase n=1 Tax=Kribbella aluminosa TaxID=416017 RepID=A0ABS4UWS6_9ACTN|nr:isochorismatase family protein [Kribbella aluminosa]MBP2356099.1 nicotinamidase-related amidase [Kribbella aluminosa]
MFHDVLTTENAAVLLVDHQIGLFTGVRDLPVAELKHNVAALASAAQLLKLPLIVTTTQSEGMWGPLVPELASVLPDDLEVIDRNTVNAWHDPRVRQAVKATGRRKLIVAGVSVEVCAALPAIAATADGYATYVAVDASGTFSSTKHETALLRLHQAGVVASDYASLVVEILADNSDRLAGDVYQALDMPFATLVGQLQAAHT